MPDPVTHRCAVLGNPIEHSLSPQLHQAAYDAMGLRGWSYERVLLDQAGLPGFLAGLDETWRGLSMTMPLKRTALPLLDELDDWAQRSRAANTVVVKRDADSALLRAYNTDIPGAMNAIRSHTSGPVARAVILGGGATATSVLLALSAMGCERATIAVRDPQRAAETVAVVAAQPEALEVDVTTLTELSATTAKADIVVCTIPAQAQDPALLAAIADVPVVFEIIYDPWPTPVAQAALDDDRTLVTGLDLLVKQAVLQVEHMTGRTDVPEPAMRAAGEAALRERSL